MVGKQILSVFIEITEQNVVEVKNNEAEVKIGEAKK